MLIESLDFSRAENHQCHLVNRSLWRVARKDAQWKNLETLASQNNFGLWRAKTCLGHRCRVALGVVSFGAWEYYALYFYIYHWNIDSRSGYLCALQSIRRTYTCQNVPLKLSQHGGPSSLARTWTRPVEDLPAERRHSWVRYSFYCFFLLVSLCVLSVGLFCVVYAIFCFVFICIFTS